MGRYLKGHSRLDFMGRLQAVCSQYVHPEIRIVEILFGNVSDALVFTHRNGNYLVVLTPD